jgi:UTP--glucose-1-phosphate uridylyltransferase
MHYLSSKKPVRKAVFPVAGLGTRFLPATKVMPKEMLPVCDRPLIQHVFEEAREAGIEEFIFVTGRHKEMLEQHFDVQPELERTLKDRKKSALLEKIRMLDIPAGSLTVTRQSQPLGLGHAVWCAAKLIGNEPFAVLLPDVLIKGGASCLGQMMQAYNLHGGNIIAVENVAPEETSSYGIVDTGGRDGKIIPIQGLVEKPKPEEAPSTLSIVGRYILQPEVLQYLAIAKTGAGGEIQLTDAMQSLVREQPFYALRFEGRSYDCGSRLGFIEANIAFGLDDEEIGGDVEGLVQKAAQRINKRQKLRLTAAE